MALAPARGVLRIRGRFVDPVRLREGATRLFDTDEGTGLGWHQAAHIQSLCKALRQCVREIRRYACEGQTADGTRYVPMAPASWEVFARPLESLLDTIEAAFLQGGGEAERSSVRPFGSTRAAISIRLGLMEEVVADLTPQKLEKAYGRLPEPVSTALEALTAAMFQHLEEARRALTEAQPATGCPGCGAPERRDGA